MYLWQTQRRDWRFGSIGQRHVPVEHRVVVDLRAAEHDRAYFMRAQRRFSHHCQHGKLTTNKQTDRQRGVQKPVHWLARKALHFTSYLVGFNRLATDGEIGQLEFFAHKSSYVAEVVALVACDQVARNWQRDVAEYAHLLVDVALVAAGHIATHP